MIRAKPAVGRARCPQRAAGFGLPSCRSILKGLRHSAQGCEPRATLGVRRVGANNPERVASSVRESTLTGLGPSFGALTQGSSSLATLGWMIQSLWDCLLDCPQ